MKYFLAIFIFLSTASDPWVDMLHSTELADSQEIHEVAENEVGLGHSSGELSSHQHENSPCAEDDCGECHNCRIGHCGTIIPACFIKFGIESDFLEISYIRQMSSIYLDVLHRPPKS